MPNWCDNSLKVKGPKEERERFEKHAVGLEHNGNEEILCADKFIPYPEKFLAMDRKADKLKKDWDEAYKAADIHDYDDPDVTNVDRLVHGKRWKAWLKAHPYPRMKDGYNSGGYDWCCKNWGTKWGFCQPNLNKIRGGLVYTFDTAWSPPIPLVKKMSQMFPTLVFTLEFDEPGCGFEGYVIYKDGTIVEQDDKLKHRRQS